MIRVQPVPEPADFQEKAAIPGRAWLATHPDATRPEDYWSPFRNALADGFQKRCAYSAMWDLVGTVDHFVSFKEDPSRAYEWSNLRFASAWMNTIKGGLRSDRLLAPFCVEDDWFELLLPSLQLVASERVPPSERELVNTFLKRMRLRDDERVIRQRRAWYELYSAGELTLSGLEKVAPLIARAVQKAQDRWRVERLNSRAAIQDSVARDKR